MDEKDIMLQPQSFIGYCTDKRAFDAFIEASPQGFLLLDSNLYVIAANTAAERLLGLKPQDTGDGVRINILDLITSIKESDRQKDYIRVAESGNPYSSQEILLDTKKRSKHLDIKAFKVNQGLGMVVAEATEASHTVEALKESEAVFRAIFDNAALGTGVVDRIGFLIRINPALQEMLGYSIDELRSMSLTDYMHRDDATADMPLFLDMVVGKRDSYQIEKRYIRKDGSIVWGYLTVSAVRNTAGEFEFAIGMIEDISDRKRAEKRLVESEKRFRSLIENAQDVIVVIKKDGIISYESSSIERMLGYKAEDLIGEDGFQFVHPEDLPIAAKAFAHLLQHPCDTISREMRVRHINGTWHDVEAVAQSFLHDPAIAGIVVNFRDITERRKADEELARYRHYLEKLVEERTVKLMDMDDQLQQEILERKRAEAELHIKENAIASSINAIIICDLEGKLTYVNEAFLNLWAYENEDEVLGQPASHFWRLGKKALSVLASLLDKHFWIGELGARRKDGSNFDVHIASSMVKNDSGEPICFMASLLDITDRKHAQEKLGKLYRQEKRLRRQLEEEMRKRIEFTRALAHELKTPLTPVVMSSQILTTRLKDETLLRVANNISRGAANLNSRIDELLDLARGEIGMLHLKPEPVDVLQVLQELVEEVTPVALSRSQSLVTRMHPSFPWIYADRGRLKQIVQNLLNNAFKFTPECGEIILRARPTKSHIIIEVHDSGPGVPKDEQQRLFDPYHRIDSDRERLSGLGLGLALCKTLIELHGGKIWVNSSLGEGSTFGISLPLRISASAGDNAG